MKYTNSEALFEQACCLMPGGVNSPVRAFNAVGGAPRFIKSGRGARITDEDNVTYIDFVGSWGPMILGHRDPDVEQAVMEAVQEGKPAAKFELNMDGVVRQEYCTVSGMLASDSCASTKWGYYKSDNVPGVCTTCGGGTSEQSAVSAIQ